MRLKSIKIISTITITLVLLIAFVPRGISNALESQSNHWPISEKQGHQDQTIIYSALNGYDWLPLGGGTNEGISSLVTDKDGNLYVGGYFTKAGGIDARIAKWDGNVWSALELGNDGYRVWDLTTDQNGNLYAAFFSNAGGILSNYISKWDGANWSMLGVKNAGIVWSITADNIGNLYAGGEFTEIGGTSANNIAMWDGGAWSALGSGTTPTIYALAMDVDGNLYAGGGFSQAGGEPVDAIAKWDGANWSGLASRPITGNISDLIFDSNNQLYVASYFGVTVWNGSSWNVLRSNSGAHALTLDEKGSLYASSYLMTIDGVGSFDIVEKWDGSNWVDLGIVLGSLGEIVYQNHKLYISGRFDTIDLHETAVAANNVAMLVAHSFMDVPLTYWAHGYIERFYTAGMTGGCTTVPLNYCPSTPVTRAQMAIFLLRGMHGSTYTPPAATGTKFNDVPLGTFGAAWIEQLATEGITSGCGGGNYCPNTQVSRAQMAIFLVRAKHGSTFVPPTATGIFADVPVGSFGANYIEQLVTDAITNGCGGTIYCPNTMVKRDSMAVFLVKTFGLP